MPQLSKTTIGWHTVRIILIGRLCRIFYKQLLKRFKDKFSIPKMIVVAALVLGFAAYKILQGILNFFLCRLMPLKTLLPFDEFFLYDSPDAPANAAILTAMKRLKFEDYKTWVKEKWCAIPDVKVQLVQYFGQFYWYKLSDQQFDALFEQGGCVKHTGIHTREQLQDWTAKLMNVEIDVLNKLPFQFHVIEDYSEDTSYVLLMGNHSFLDGVTCVTSFKMLSEDFDPSKIKKMPVMPMWKTLLGYALTPILTVKIAWLMATLPIERNCIKKAMPVKNQRHLILSQDFDYKQFTKSRRIVKCSDVQAFHAILGQAIKEYCRRQGEDIEKIWISSTISLKAPPTDIKDLKFGNYFVPAVLPLYISDSLSKNIDASMKYYRQYIGSLDLIGFVSLAGLTNSLPYNLAKLGQRMFTSKLTLSFSSLPNMADGFLWNGMKSKGFYGVGPACSEMQTMFIFIPCDGILRYSLANDRSYIEKPEEFVQILDAKIKEFIKISQTEDDKHLQQQQLSLMQENQENSSQKIEFKMNKL